MNGYKHSISFWKPYFLATKELERVEPHYLVNCFFYLSSEENVWENWELIAILSVEKQCKSPSYHWDNICSERADYQYKKKD